MTQLQHPNRRTMLAASIAAGAAWTFPQQSARAAMANDEIRLGFISCGGRAGEHLQAFSKLEGCRVAGLCDPDAKRVAEKKKQHTEAKTFTDLRELLDDKNIDAVVVATTNHWHCLAAIWAMQAGKDVYVEKPLSHSQWEGEQTVAAARKYNRICQVGTQQRSDPMQAEIKKFLHQDKSLGKILSCRVNRYGVRAPIGRRDKPLEIDASVNYDLWLGPAQDLPIYRDNLQYDWHWDFNTGSGEMGNWGVHVLDDARNNVFLDKVTLPTRVMGGGGRVVYNDAGETPNVHFVYFDTGEVPTIIGLSNLPEAPKSNKSPKVPGPGSGYIAVCEGGRLEGQRGKAVAFDKNGKQIRTFSGNSGGRLHQQNFLDAVRRRDATMLNTEVLVGHHSTGWCNLANVAYRAGSQYSAPAAASLAREFPAWGELIEEMKRHLAAHAVDIASMEIRLSPMLEFSPEAGKFTGNQADKANAFLKREYRSVCCAADYRISPSMMESQPKPDPRLLATAYHEAGHAVMALGARRPIHRVTVVPSQQYLGACQIQKGRFRPTKDWLEDEILILFAGMVAESQITGQYCESGASQDLRGIRRFALMRAGGERQVERLERRLLDKSEHLISDAATWKAIELIANALIQHETISGRAARHFFDLATQGN